MSQDSLDDALDSLTALLEDVEWHKPIGRARTVQIRIYAVRIRDLIDDAPHPTIAALALMGCMDCILEWLLDPTDAARVTRLLRSYGLYSEMYDAADES